MGNLKWEQMTYKGKPIEGEIAHVSLGSYVAIKKENTRYMLIVGSAHSKQNYYVKDFATPLLAKQHAEFIAQTAINDAAEKMKQIYNESKNPKRLIEDGEWE